MCLSWHIFHILSFKHQILNFWKINKRKQYNEKPVYKIYYVLILAQGAGDPHLTTLDGLDYTFNGVGDFILVEDSNSSAVIQVRAVQAKDPNGNCS